MQTQYQEVPQQDYQSKSFIHESLGTNLRINFVRKVFSIVSIQLLFTSLVAYGAMKSALIEYICFISYIPCIITGIVSVLWLYFSRNAARTFPKNFILLGIFTISEAICLGSPLSQIGDQEVVVHAAIITLGVVIALTAYALSTKNDITLFGGIVFLLLSTSIILSIILFIFRTEFLYTLYLGLGALIYGIYLIYDIQLICGNSKLQLSIDDYIFASIMLYTDIIKLFIQILKILDKLKKKSDD